MRWRKVLCGVMCVVAVQVHAQQAQYAFRISFTDKAGAPPLSNPLAFLSQRAIDRRAAKTIAVDATDQPVSSAYVNDVLSHTGGKLHLTSRWFNNAVILVTDTSSIPALRNKPFVADARYIAFYPSGLHKMTAGDKWKNEKLGSLGQFKTTGSSAFYGDSYEQTRLVKGDYLHDRGYKGQGKLIAVLDDGFAGVNTGLGFDSLVKSGRLIDKYDFVYATTNVFDYSSHGTGCLSTMAAYLPGTYVGSAPLAEYALYVTDYGQGDQAIEMDNMVAATERADSLGADVISSSLGYNYFFPLASLTYADIDGKTTIASRGANMATAKGIVFVITAGNEGGNSWNKILTPGDADSALTVGNVDMNKNPAPSSGYGPNTAGRIKPDVCLAGNPASIMLSGPNPTFSSGTSYATPQMAGWAACLLQASSTAMLPYKLRKAVQESAHAYNTPGPQLGYGVPDFGLAYQLLGIIDVPSANTDTWVAVKTNPVGTRIDLVITMQQNGEAQLSVTDVSGKIVYSKVQNLVKGAQQLYIETTSLSAGIYFMKVVADGRQSVTKLVKQ